MRRERTVQIGAIVCMLAFLGVGAGLSTVIAASVGRNKLVYTDKAEAGDPPQVALGIAMGAFRGLFVNFLWIRANDMKEAGKYFEAVDLAKTITRLQPRFPKVWQFHAWNMAYNISVATQTQQERWNWVQAGIRLLRNEGIPANPNDLNLHRELAWIHLHKVQGYMDDAHRYYKWQLAREWTVVLGAPPNLGLEQWTNPEAATQQYIDHWIGPIADAPDSLDDLYAKTPLARDFIEQAHKLGFELDFRFLERVAMLQSVLAASEATQVPASGIKDDPMARLLTDAKFGPAGKAVRAFARKRVLVDQYHMEPARMIRYMKRFGPLDWRHPAAHALYWSTRGSEEALMRMSKENEKDFDLVNTDRMTIQSIQELFRTGTLTFDIINPQLYLALPNTAYLDKYRELMESLRKRSKFDDAARPYGLYGAGYENFMRDAIRYLYRRGDEETAKRYQKDLYSYPGLNTNHPDLYHNLSRPLEEFVQSEILDSGKDPNDSRATNPTVALQEVSGALQSAYVNGLLRGDMKAFAKEFDYARLFHATYQNTQSFKVWVAGSQGRLGFPKFEFMASEVLAQLIQIIGLPQGPEMYRRAPIDLQARAYVFLERSALKTQLDQAVEKDGEPPFNVWFPEPKNVAQYRMELFQSPDPPNKGRIEQK